MAAETLRAMALGGMRDHIGGGFHRYSVDAEWRVPHFEKMLYDQAQLVLAYLEAAQATGEPFFFDVAEDTLVYVLRDMTDPAGGFYSAEDADSIPPEQADAAGRAQDGGRLLHLERRGDRVRSSAATSTWPAARFGLEAGGQRAARSARRVHRQEPALRRASRVARHRGAHRPHRGRRAGGARPDPRARCSRARGSVRGRISTTRS